MLKKNDFQELMEKYDRKIFDLFCFLCGNNEDAKELTQITFVYAYKSFDNFRQESSAYTWLYRIAVNVCPSARTFI